MTAICEARCLRKNADAHAGLARRPQGAERQLMEEDQTNRRTTIEHPIWSQNDPYATPSVQRSRGSKSLVPEGTTVGRAGVR